MPLTRLALSNPVAVAVGCILLVIFGLLSLFRLPVQMTPNIDRPTITISTGWRAAAPAEIESEILEPQENLLRDVPGLQSMNSTASQGRASISLEFGVNADLNRALIEVINRLNTEIARIIQLFDVRARWGQLGAEPVDNTPAQFASWLDSESVKWIKVIKDSGAKAD